MYYISFHVLEIMSCMMKILLKTIKWIELIMCKRKWLIAYLQEVPTLQRNASLQGLLALTGSHALSQVGT